VEALLALLGVVVGAVLGGVFQVWNRRSEDRAGRQAELRQIRRDLYFEALDVLESIDHALKELGRSATDYRVATEQVPQDPDQLAAADDLGVVAINSMFEALRTFQRKQELAAAVGSPNVSAAMKEAGSVFGEYRDGMLSDGPVFSAARYNQFLLDFSRQRADLSEAVREDLRVDALFKENGK
jgi:hypothetical protein